MDIKEKIQENKSLKDLTTYKIGGSAKFFVEVKTKEDLVDVYAFAKKEKLEIFLLGGGSNVLINSEGVNGLVAKMSNNELTAHGDRMNCGAGVSLAGAIRLATSDKLSGLEWAVGIPSATFGGTVRGNGGAYGKNISDLVETVDVFNIKKQRFEVFSNRDCKFKYRESIFKLNNNYIIWSIVLKLYRGSAKSILETNEKNLNARNQFQPKLPSAGCVFKNINIEDLRNMNSQIADIAEKEGAVKGGKIGAGWIIDMAGLKGKTIGDAKVSLEHANFIVNTSNASSGDIVMLISYIKQKVRNKFKVQLQEEIQYVGFL